MNERLRIGREIKQALDDIIPKERRLSDAQIAKEIGVSQQMVTRIELLALYKIRQKFKELLAREAGIRDSTDFGIHDVETLNSVAA